MKNQELSRAFRLFAEGFNALANAYEPTEGSTPIKSESVVENRGTSIPTTPSKPVEVKKEVAPIEVKKEVVAPVKEVEKVAEPEVKEETTKVLTKEDLEALSYNEVKTIAKEYKVKAVGSKSSIIANILEVLESAVEEDEEVEEIQEETAPVEEESLDIVEDEEDNEEEGEEDHTFYDKVVADLEEYSDEELADILSEIGISPKGKRQALLSKIVQAIEDGKLEWESEESTEEVAPPNEDKSEDDDMEEEEYDFVTEARKETCLALDSQIRKDFKANKITPKDLVKSLKEFDSEYVSEGKENDLENYILLKMNLVDEDGTEHDLSEAYYVGDNVFCCGVELQELDKDYFCEVCGQKYEK